MLGNGLPPMAYKFTATVVEECPKNETDGVIKQILTISIKVAWVSNGFALIKRLNLIELHNLHRSNFR